MHGCSLFPSRLQQQTQLGSRAPARTPTKPLRREGCSYASREQAPVPLPLQLKNGLSWQRGWHSIPPLGSSLIGINVGAGHGHGTVPGASHPLMANLKLSLTRARRVRFAPHLLLICNCISRRATFVLDEQMEPSISEEPGRMLKSIKPGY